MKTVRICGHSHLAALQDGYRALEQRRVNVEFVPLSGAKYRPEDFSQVEAEGVAFLPEIYQKNFAERTGETHINDEHLYGFSMGGYPFRLYGGGLWRRSRPWPLAEDKKRPISLAMMDTIIAADHRATQNFVLHLKDVGAQFFFIALPAAIRNFYDDDTERDILNRAFIQNRARQQFQNFLKEQGVGFIGIPEELTDKDGFMNPDYMRLIKPNGAKDFNHGNAKLGKLMIQKISEYVINQNI